MAAMGACRLWRGIMAVQKSGLSRLTALDGALSKPSRVVRRLLTSLRQNYTCQIACRAFCRPCRPAFLPSASQRPGTDRSLSDLQGGNLDAVLFLQAGANATCPWNQFTIQFHFSSPTQTRLTSICISIPQTYICGSTGTRQFTGLVSGDESPWIWLSHTRDPRYRQMTTPKRRPEQRQYHPLPVATWVVTLSTTEMQMPSARHNSPCWCSPWSWLSQRRSFAQTVAPKS